LTFLRFRVVKRSRIGFALLFESFLNLIDPLSLLSKGVQHVLHPLVLLSVHSGVDFLYDARLLVLQLVFYEHLRMLSKRFFSSTIDQTRRYLLFLRDPTEGLRKLLGNSGTCLPGHSELIVVNWCLFLLVLFLALVMNFFGLSGLIQIVRRLL